MANGRRVLQRYSDRIAAFNDDMQGTGATCLAAVLAGVRTTGIPLRDQRVVVFGAGTAGVGIADQLRDAIAADGLSVSEATARVYCVDRHGLLTDDMPDLLDFQQPYARPIAEVADWQHDRALGGHSARRGAAPGAPHHPAGHVNPRRGVHRGHGSGTRLRGETTDHSANVQPDRADGSPARRCDHLDRGTGPGRLG